MKKAKRGHRRPDQGASGRPRIWGRHAAFAALDNPERNIRKLWVTRELASQLVIDPAWPLVVAEAPDLGRLVPNDAPHQGIVVEVDPLEDIWLGDLLADPDAGDRPLLILDQVTDPHNVGAILRSAAAFNALGIVTQDRHSPPEFGHRRALGIGCVRGRPLGPGGQPCPRFGRNSRGRILAHRLGGRDGHHIGRGHGSGKGRSGGRRRG